MPQMDALHKSPNLELSPCQSTTLAVTQLAAKTTTIPRLVRDDRLCKVIFLGSNPLKLTVLVSP
jgi:hypothetical protein